MEENVSRKDFFKLAIKNAKSCAYELLEGCATAADMIQKAAGPPPELMRFVRPPGTLPEKEFLAVCTRCDDCVKACPEMAIRKAGPGFGNNVADTPIIIPQENPCLFCERLPCIAACTTGALKPYPAGKTPRIGMAVVDVKTCHLALGRPCEHCERHCPVEPKAILARTPGTPPAVDAEACTGCGKCAQICPPNAIRIESLS